MVNVLSGKPKKFCSECQKNKSLNVIVEDSKNYNINKFHTQALAKLHSLAETYYSFSYSRETQDLCFTEIKEVFDYLLDKGIAVENDYEVYKEFEQELINNVAKDSAIQRLAIRQFIPKVIKDYG